MVVYLSQVDTNKIEYNVHGKARLKLVVRRKIEVTKGVTRIVFRQYIKFIKLFFPVWFTSIFQWNAFYIYFPMIMFYWKDGIYCFTTDLTIVWL